MASLLDVAMYLTAAGVREYREVDEYVEARKTEYRLIGTAIEDKTGKRDGAIGSKATIAMSEDIVFSDLVDSPVLILRTFRKADRVQGLVGSEERAQRYRSPLAERTIRFVGHDLRPEVDVGPEFLGALVSTMTPRVFPDLTEILLQNEQGMKRSLTSVLCPSGVFFRTSLKPIKEAVGSATGPAMALTYLSMDQLFGTYCLVEAKRAKEPEAGVDKITFEGDAKVDVGGLIGANDLTDFRYSHELTIHVDGDASMRLSPSVEYKVNAKWKVMESIVYEHEETKVVLTADWEVVYGDTIVGRKQ